MKSINKKIIFLIIVAAILVSIVISISYGYFDDEDIGNYVVYLGDNYTLSTESDGIDTIDIDNLNNFGANSNQELVNYDVNLNVILDNNSDKNVTCTYDFAWRWDMSNSEYVKSENVDGINIKEYTVAIDSSEEKQVPDYNADTMRIDVNSSNITAISNSKEINRLQIKIKFYNIAGINQSMHQGKKYKGGVVLDNVTCTEN